MSPPPRKRCWRKGRRTSAEDRSNCILDFSVGPLRLRATGAWCSEGGMDDSVVRRIRSDVPDEAGGFTDKAGKAGNAAEAEEGDRDDKDV